MDTVVLRDSITGKYSDEEFFKFCAENRGLRIERNNKLEIVIMSPTSSFSGRINAEVIRQLSNWNAACRLGEVFDSSTGFCLPDRSVFSPDAAWVSNEKWRSLTEEQKNSFAPVCPEFVIEIRSKSDYVNELLEKINSWIENGANLVWLIDPIDKKVYFVYPDRERKIHVGFDRKINGEEPVSGFELDLSLLLRD